MKVRHRHQHDVVVPPRHRGFERAAEERIAERLLRRHDALGLTGGARCVGQQDVSVGACASVRVRASEHPASQAPRGRRRLASPGRTRRSRNSVFGSGLDLRHRLQELRADKHQRRLGVVENPDEFVDGATPIESRERAAGLGRAEPDLEHLDRVLAEEADRRTSRDAVANQPIRDPVRRLFELSVCPA